MDFSDVMKRAVDVRTKYAQLEKKRIGRPWTTSELTQGFVVDVGELMELVMAKEGDRVVDDVDAKLKHELCDCLWSLLNLADRYHVDFESEFITAMDHLDARIDENMKE